MGIHPSVPQDGVIVAGQISYIVEGREYSPGDGVGPSTPLCSPPLAGPAGGAMGGVRRWHSSFLSDILDDMWGGTYGTPEAWSAYAYGVSYVRCALMPILLLNGAGPSCLKPSMILAVGLKVSMEGVLFS